MVKWGCRGWAFSCRCRGCQYFVVSYQSRSIVCVCASASPHAHADTHMLSPLTLFLSHIASINSDELPRVCTLHTHPRTQVSAHVCTRARTRMHAHRENEHSRSFCTIFENFCTHMHTSTIYSHTHTNKQIHTHIHTPTLQRCQKSGAQRDR